MFQMARRYSSIDKAELGELLASWYRNFGKVAPRRGYHDDDDSGSGEGGAKPPWENHPLFADTPIGAPSDLASVLVADKRTLAEAEERKNEACDELKNNLAMRMTNEERLENRYRNTIKPQPV
jgi:hypothetical protein